MDKLAQKIINLLREELEVTIYEKIHYPDDLAAKIEELINDDLAVRRLKGFENEGLNKDEYEDDASLIIYAGGR